MISVIVPVYNVEEYLEECLDSIKNQTYTNIEVILVNDGSTDASKEICERYCSKDNRFKLINQSIKDKVLRVTKELPIQQANLSLLWIVMMLFLQNIWRICMLT